MPHRLELIARRSPNVSWDLNTEDIEDQEQSHNSRKSLGKYQQQGLLILASVSAKIGRAHV